MVYQQKHHQTIENTNLQEAKFKDYIRPRLQSHANCSNVELSYPRRLS